MELNGWDSDTVRSLLHFMYTGEYHTISDTTGPPARTASSTAAQFGEEIGLGRVSLGFPAQEGFEIARALFDPSRTSSRQERDRWPPATPTYDNGRFSKLFLQQKKCPRTSSIFVSAR